MAKPPSGLTSQAGLCCPFLDEPQDPVLPAESSDVAAWRTWCLMFANDVQGNYFRLPVPGGIARRLMGFEISFLACFVISSIGRGRSMP